MVFKVLTLVFLFLPVIYFINRSLLEDLFELLADKAYKELYYWRLANPCACIGDSFYACCLVRKRIKALERYWKFCNTEKDTEQLKYLRSLLSEHFDPPGRGKAKPKQSRSGTVFILWLLFQMSVTLLHHLVRYKVCFCHHEVVRRLNTKVSRLTKNLQRL